MTATRAGGRDHGNVKAYSGRAFDPAVAKSSHRKSDHDNDRRNDPTSPSTDIMMATAQASTAQDVRTSRPISIFNVEIKSRDAWVSA
jgi:hypothetical protein